MSDSPLVSVVMPVWNPHPDFFPQAVASVLAQTYRNFELLILEDPSPRSAEEMLARFNDSRIRFSRHPERSNLCESLNRGLAQAKGDLVMRFDADDVCEPERLAKQVAFLSEHPEVGVVGSQLKLIDEENRPIGYRVYPQSNAEILAAMPIYNSMGQPSVIFRKQPVLEAGGYHVRPFNEDYELWSRLAQRGVQFANHPEALVQYRIHREAAKSTKLRGILSDTLYIKRTYWGDRLGFRGRMRYWAETALLYLPASWVLGLFLRTQIRRELPPR